jgi:hypothetical protein
MFLPLRESRRNPDPALPRDRSKLRRLHPWRLGSESLRLLQRWGRLNGQAERSIEMRRKAAHDPDKDARFKNLMHRAGLPE